MAVICKVIRGGRCIRVLLVAQRAGIEMRRAKVGD